jgi:hypothetical protein
VLVAPPGSSEAKLLLARAIGAEQVSRIAIKRVAASFSFCTRIIFGAISTRTREGVVFVREPVEESYGTVAVFQDLYGNLWDLLQLKP